MAVAARGEASARTRWCATLAVPPAPAAQTRARLEGLRCCTRRTAARPCDAALESCEVCSRLQTRRWTSAGAATRWVHIALKKTFDRRIACIASKSQRVYTHSKMRAVAEGGAQRFAVCIAQQRKARTWEGNATADEHYRCSWGKTQPYPGFFWLVMSRIMVSH